jgi:hypothetical protein
VVASVDVEDLAGDLPRRVGEQEEDRVGDVPRLGQAAERQAGGRRGAAVGTPEILGPGRLPEALREAWPGAR